MSVGGPRLQTVERALGGSRYRQAVARGRALSVEDAVRFAFERSGA